MKYLPTYICVYIYNIYGNGHSSAPAPGNYAPLSSFLRRPGIGLGRRMVGRLLAYHAPTVIIIRIMKAANLFRPAV